MPYGNPDKKGPWVKVPGKNRSHPDRVVATEKQLHALELRKQGLNYEEIAEMMGISRQGAWDAVSKGLKNYARVTDEIAEDVREMEIARMDKMLATHLDLAVEGSTRSAEIVLKIMDRRAKLLGLDTPVKQKIEHTGKDGEPIEHSMTFAQLVMHAYKDEDVKVIENKEVKEDDNNS